MEFLNLPARQVPVLTKTEVIVVGGGPAGLGASVASRRQGCRTLLIDQGGILGGIVTKVIMPSFGSLNFSLIKGLFLKSARN